MRRLTAVVLLTAALLAAQSRNPVLWTAAVDSGTVAPGGSVSARLIAKMEPTWHIYALTSPAGGPTPTTVKLGDTPLASSIKVYQPKPAVKFDPNFNINVEAFEGEVTFLSVINISEKASEGDAEIPLLLRYQACTDRECLPKKATLAVKVRIDKKAPASTVQIPTNYIEFTGQRSPALPAPAKSSPQDQDLWSFLLVAFGFGLGAILTPCVFPMIPITLSFFLNRPGVLRQAILFCLGIVIMFTGMGLLVTALLGPFGVVQLAANPWINGFIALVFVFFGLSLLGAFEITLPSALLTKMDRASQRGGSLGTLLMGLTFSLTSFACVGPFIGPLLAGSVQRGGLQPALGMMAFSSGLASPFFLLALFPSYLQKLPRSGGWLARVKVVLGFILIAVSLKYLSSIDQVLQWEFLTRERFLAAWVVLFALPGLYLLGFLRMEGIRPDESVGVGRTLVGAVFLIFAVSLIPGMFGGRLGELDSYVPLAKQGSGVAGSAATEIVWMKNDLNGALAKAKADNKKVFVAFTGYACTNCKWMKTNMFTRPEIAQMMSNFVLLELYTDGTDAASEANQQLQESKFQTVSIPFYAVFDSGGNVTAQFPGLTRKPTDFLAFLQNP
ncbi:MAG TPA: cytochrome c biogenesis protein CcdA [Bryobacteraceae bacterium]|nr:cytochrome c biogenesis protein CcdA [Bryobacteraceae bacterium]